MKPITSETSMSSETWCAAREATVYDCALLALPQITNRAGNITVLEPGTNCPFPIPRVYYLYDVPGGASRGGHAHRDLHQLIVAASGSFEVLIDDGRNRRTVMLNRPNNALHIVPGIWRELHNFSSGSICLALASHAYDDKDYLRSHEAFVAWKSFTKQDSQLDIVTSHAG